MVFHKQVGGNHYKGLDYEPLRFMLDAKFHLCISMALKYASRAGKKGNEIEDWNKAIHYLEIYEYEMLKNEIPVVNLLPYDQIERYASQFKYGLIIRRIIDLGMMDKFFYTNAGADLMFVPAEFKTYLQDTIKKIQFVINNLENQS